MDGFYHFDAGTTVQPSAGLRGDGRVHGGAVTALLALAFSGVLPAAAACAAAVLLGWS